MPTIIVLADTDDGASRTELHQQVSADLMADPRGAGELIERIAFALVAAEQTERESRARAGGNGGCGCGVAHGEAEHNAAAG